LSKGRGGGATVEGPASGGGTDGMEDGRERQGMKSIGGCRRREEGYSESVRGPVEESCDDWDCHVQGQAVHELRSAADSRPPAWAARVTVQETMLV
jgi:hypothetical protein